MKNANAFVASAMLVFVMFESARAEDPDAESVRRDELRAQVRQLESQVERMKSDVSGLESLLRYSVASATISVHLVFGIFCALWAQNRRRNSWLWFFLGFSLALLAGIMMLYRNFMDRLSEDIAKTSERLKRYER